MSSEGLSSLPVMLLFYLGGLGPPLAGISLTYLRGGRDLQRDYWRRVFGFKRIGGWWYAFILLAMPILTVLSIYLTAIFTREDPISGFRSARVFLSNPLTILPFALGILVFGPLPEELGWRGYAQDRLQQRFTPLLSSLILGAAWGVWHLPTYFIPGTFQHSLGAGSMLFWTFMLGMIPQSVLIGWAYNKNQRSTLSAILFHFSINFSGEFFDPSVAARGVQFIFTLALGIIVALILRNDVK